MFLVYYVIGNMFVCVYIDVMVIGVVYGCNGNNILDVIIVVVFM